MIEAKEQKLNTVFVLVVLFIGKRQNEEGNRTEIVLNLIFCRCTQEVGE